MKSGKILFGTRVLPVTFTVYWKVMQKATNDRREDLQWTLSCKACFGERRRDVWRLSEPIFHIGASVSISSLSPSLFINYSLYSFTYSGINSNWHHNAHQTHTPFQWSLANVQMVNVWLFDQQMSGWQMSEWCHLISLSNVQQADDQCDKALQINVSIS